MARSTARSLQTIPERFSREHLRASLFMMDGVKRRIRFTSFGAILFAFALTRPVVAQSFYDSCYDGAGNIYNATLIISAVSVADFNGQALSPGSELAVFSTRERFENQCIGRTVWQGVAGYITMWGDDPITSSVEALRAGDSFEIRVYDPQSGFEFGSALLTTEYEGGPVAFEIDRIFKLSSLSVRFGSGAPVAQDDRATMLEDGRVEIDVLANDYPGDSGVVDILDVTLTSGTAIIIPERRTIEYTPDENFFGVTAFTYTIRDSNNRIDEATVTITVDAVNDPPIIASEPILDGQEGEIYRYEIRASDVDNDNLTFLAVQIPPWMSLLETGGDTSVLEGIPSGLDAGVHDVIVAVDDGSGPVEQTFTIAVVMATDPPQRPKLSEPAHLSTAIALNHRFVWKRAPGTVRTRIQVALYVDFSFSSVLLDEWTKNSWFDVEQLSPETRYMWRVRAENSAGETEWAPIHSFTTIAATVTGFEDDTNIPEDFRLDQNYPNPFNPETTIEFAIPVSEHIRLEIFDILGRSRAVLVDRVLSTGVHRAVWDASGESSGLYIYIDSQRGQTL